MNYNDCYAIYYHSTKVVRINNLELIKRGVNVWLILLVFKEYYYKIKLR